MGPLSAVVRRLYEVAGSPHGDNAAAPLIDEIVRSEEVHKRFSESAPAGFRFDLQTPTQLADLIVHLTLSSWAMLQPADTFQWLLEGFHPYYGGVMGLSGFHSPAKPGSPPILQKETYIDPYDAKAICEREPEAAAGRSGLSRCVFSAQSPTAVQVVHEDTVVPVNAMQQTTKGSSPTGVTLFSPPEPPFSGRLKGDDVLTIERKSALFGTR